MSAYYGGTEVTLMDELKRRNLSSLAAKRIREYIVENDLRKGDRLPSESKLMRALGVGRSTIREAIKQIEMSGLLEVRPGQGARIKDFDFDQALSQASWGIQFSTDESRFRDLYESRYTLEMAVLPLIVERADGEDLAALCDVADKLSTERAVDRHRQLDVQFHLKLLECSHNQVLAQLGRIVLEFFAQIRKKSPDQIFPESSVYSTGPSSYFDHRRIYEAVEGRNLQDLQRIMEAHFRNYKPYFESTGSEDRRMRDGQPDKREKASPQGPERGADPADGE
jgi:GntR family transcriptional repressor for pyruvate dehydrogenase complex